MLITVMMPVYNTRKEYFEEAIESTLIAIKKFNKKYGNESELLIGDDGSTNEETISVLNKYENHENIRIVHFIHSGHPQTLNKMLYDYTENSKFICYFDSDDVMVSNRLLVQYEYMINPKNANVTIIGANTTNLIPWFNNIRFVREYYFRRIVTSNIHIMNQNPFCHPTIFYNRNDIVSHNIKYNEDDSFTCDYNFYCDIFSNNLFALFIPEAVIMYRIKDNENQITALYANEIRSNIKVLQEKYNI